MAEVEEHRLQVVDNRWSGFWNLVAKENREWLSGWTWFLHTIIWLAIVAGVSVLVSFSRVFQDSGASPEAVNQLGAVVLFVMTEIAAVVAVVVKTQGTIVGEKQNGTAEWVLSKPASRKAFVLSKFVVHLGWLLTVTLLVPATFVYLCLPVISDSTLPLLPFLYGISVMALNLVFYLALSLLLGTIFGSRGPLAGLLFGFMLTGFALVHFNVSPLATSIFPWLLFESGRAIVAGDGLPAAALASIIATVTWSTLFLFLTLWRFDRVEF